MPEMEHFNGVLIDFFEQSMRGKPRVLCPNCGIEFAAYIQTGRLGCSKCYDVFHEQIARQVSLWTK